MIVSSSELVDALVAPVPLELLAFGLDATLRALGELGEARVTDEPASPDDGVLAGYLGPIRDPGELARRLSATPKVVGHGRMPVHIGCHRPGNPSSSEPSTWAPPAALSSSTE